MTYELFLAEAAEARKRFGAATATAEGGIPGAEARIAALEKALGGTGEVRCRDRRRRRWRRGGMEVLEQGVCARWLLGAGVDWCVVLPNTRETFASPPTRYGELLHLA